MPDERWKCPWCGFMNHGYEEPCEAAVCKYGQTGMGQPYSRFLRQLGRDIDKLPGAVLPDSLLIAPGEFLRALALVLERLEEEGTL